jgi:hypothetical protein
MLYGSYLVVDTLYASFALYSPALCLLPKSTPHHDLSLEEESVKKNENQFALLKSKLLLAWCWFSR